MSSQSCQQNPRISSVLERCLNEFEFEGGDVSKEISLFEYGVLYSRRHEVALLCFPQRPYPIKLEEIPVDDVWAELECADVGFFRYIGSSYRKERERDRPIEVIQSMMQWNGGWHLDSQNWKPFCSQNQDSLAFDIRRLCLDSMTSVNKHANISSV